MAHHSKAKDRPKGRFFLDQNRPMRFFNDIIGDKRERRLPLGIAKTNAPWEESGRMVRMELGFTPSSFPEKAVSELLENIFTYAAEGMALIGPDYTVKKANERFLRLVSAPVRNWHGGGIDQLIPDFDLKLRRLCLRVKERKEPFITEALKLLPVFSRDQTFVGWLLLVLDGWESSFVF